MHSGRCKIASFFALLTLLTSVRLLNAQATGTSLQLSRPIRTWEFLPVVGTRAALLGNEAGKFEAWVYPLKILRNFHLVFHSEGRALPAESLARTLLVQPESCVITYASDTFQVRETLFVPVREAGAVITFEVTTAQPLEIEAAFERDFQLEWPAALGGTYMQWNPGLRAFYLGEEQKKFAALVGSPSAVLGGQEYATNYSSSSMSSVLLGPVLKGRETKVIVIAASVEGEADAENTYKKLSSSYTELLRDSAEYYRRYLDSTVQLHLPDSELQQAYDWARISMAQGIVTNFYLGTSLVAGYRTSGDGQRPGFAWFFGRDALWTDLALDACGDFATTRSTLEFLAKFQRADGKIPHEISQSAGLVPWFTAFPYGYASVDATPLYIIAADDYVSQSGDLAFASQHWNTIWKAYEFLRSTYDAQGWPQNFGFGHGWVEGGPLLPVKTELYQSGVGSEALRALADLAHRLGKDDVSHDLDSKFQQRTSLLNQAFWSSDKKYFSFALDRDDKQVEIPTVLSTVPMWFNLLEEAKAESTINVLADADHETDWGMRIISAKQDRYNPGGYHFGSVWPLFTGWASVGEYRYHRAFPAYANLRANALLTLNGSIGHVTEVLSGDYFEPLSTSSPHQIWSAAMVVSPLLRGMLGLQVDAATHTISFSPHVPYNWTSFDIANLKVGECTVTMHYHRAVQGISLEVQRSGSGPCTLAFSPAVSLRANLGATDVNGHKLSVRADKNSIDQHATVAVPLEIGANTIHLRVDNDFGLYLDSQPTPLASASQGLRLVAESSASDRKAVTFDWSGLDGHTYQVGIWNAREIARVEGADLEENGGGSQLRISFPATGTQDYVHAKITIHFHR
jgi:glycogen debranching enzyme